MGLVSFTPVVNGNNAQASDVNDPLNTIYDEFNGNIDQNNIADNAIITAKINNAAVTTAKIADANVTSTKLAEAFLRLRRQDNTTNSAPTGYLIQSGWGFVTGTSSNTGTKTVTFPTAFSAAPIVLMTSLGAKGTDPANISDFTTNQTSNEWNFAAQDIVAASFVARCIRDGTSMGTLRIGFTWLAIGAA